MDMLHSSSAKLEPFLLMSKSAKGAAAAKLIETVTAAPGVFVFAELLDTPSISELKTSEQFASSYHLLELFAYHTYGDYKAKPMDYPPLSPAQLTKIKHLSLVSLAATSRILPYAQLLQYLDLSSIRELEDLVIDAIYANVVRGKLDQKEQRFEVEYTMGRDVPPEQMGKLLESLQLWSQRTTQVLSALDNRITSIQSSAAVAQRKIADHEAARDKLMNELAANKGGRAAMERRKQLQDSDMDIDLSTMGTMVSMAWEQGSPEKGRKKLPASGSSSARKRGRDVR
ncbi:hypothetical protein DACRYDRAFT_82679 [Dacryopinax primogenitus]|uniref:PCI domain-containing protein n=1 Tax=Dacryopinax primogenitus (strain DJM 731) TaxID=1858805 RepID=M5FSK5_DACPD|nr:uncharacterized protein DACRYDRAFT_82679 [Dacryopinax primogenitus]EJT98888.1 hypothetical protein DACRYDRAFT_82679 [Dacryopinax primogenitus]